MSHRIRLITRDQRDAIRESGLHDLILRCGVRRKIQKLLTAIDKSFEGDSEVFVAEAANMLATRLRTVESIANGVRETVGYGVTSITSEDEWFHLLALWVIENQLSDSLEWKPTSKIQRRRKK